MKNFILVFTFSTILAFAQIPAEKFSNQLKNYLSKSKSDTELLVWIFFSDKGPKIESHLSKPQTILSQKSIQRRAKLKENKSLLDETDVPISQNYIQQIEAKGFKLKQKSKWLNGISGYLRHSSLDAVSNLPFVKQIDLVSRLRKEYETFSADIEIKSENNVLQKVLNNHSYDYGTSFTQVQQINVPSVHDLGFIGQGVTICVMDAGFDNLSHEVFSSMNIIAAYDFVNNDSGVDDSTDMGKGSHGTATLSAIGGFKEGKLIGPAFGANFILAKTENTDSETPIEEDNWIAALEWADSIGVDVTSTSLGYLGYDAPFTGYTWENMDGNTARITIAADLAVKKGIVVVNSAGNQGFHAEHNTIGAPSDGDSVIAVGAVTSTGLRASFSSVGNTVDGRIKPDIMAMGSGVVLASSTSISSYKTGSGTSFSCPLAAGVAAIILSHNPELTPIQVRDLLRSSGSRSQNPDREYGWGIIDALKAINNTVPVELSSFNAKIIDGKVQLEWITVSENNVRGFTLERAENNKPFIEVAFININGISNGKKTYNYLDEQVLSGKYLYRLKVNNFDGSVEIIGETFVIVEPPAEFQLSQNYPNPFNPYTNITYTIPYTSKVRLGLYNVLGKELSVIFDGYLEAGKYSAIISSDYLGLSSGIYFIKMETAEFKKLIKLTLVK
ncbi:MAG: S8 family peptidase [Ignavibacteriaceae bacterium]|nr:S8 family peptidase [Ignavibacteriaceae bacterium]